jgi:hypothetical protein
MVSRYTSANAKLKQGGFSATHNQDFIAHTSGGDFKHTADQIDLQSSISGISATQVQDALEQLHTQIASAGSGFISIGRVGDGYAQGSYNVSDSNTFEDALSQAFADERVINGGIVLILAGQYNISTAVTIPVGISLWGELAGTYIDGTTSEESLFIIDSDISTLDVGGDSGGGVKSVDNGSNYKLNKLFNLILSDNLYSTGATMTTVGMISVKRGGNLECEKVTFLGKLNNGSALNRLKTQAAVKTIAGVVAGTSIKLTSCFIDGVRNTIISSTGLDTLDFISLEHSKVRWFGGEGNSYSIANDSCIYTTTANVVIDSSFLLGGSRINTQTILGLNNTIGDSSTAKITINNISGGLSSDPPPDSNTVGILVDSLATMESIQIVATGNNWGHIQNNSWFITIASSEDTSVYGDIYGTGAFDLVVNYASFGFFQGTVIVNPGTFTYVGTIDPTATFANIKIIGNKKGIQYPVIQLNIASTAVDDLGYRFLILGNHIESIYFNGIGANLCSIRPSFNPVSSEGGDDSTPSNGTINIKDCYFTDAILNVLGLGSNAADYLGESGFTNIKIEDCCFQQTGTFDPYLNLSCPLGSSVNLKNCSILGGYYLSVRQYDDDVVLSRATVTLDRVFCSGGTVDVINPLGVVGHVFINCAFNDTTVNIYNSEFISSTTLDNNSSLIGGGLNSSGIYSYFSFISANHINIYNSTFNGPNQVFTSAAVDYPIPACIINPQQSAKIENNVFIGGALPLQVQGTLSSNTVKENIVISNNNFLSGNTASANQKSQTLLDVDIDSASTTSTTLIVKDNTFRCAPSSSVSAPPKHTYVTGATYNTNACAQIYCKGLNAIVSNNHIITALYDVTAFSQFAGLSVNTYNSDAGSSSIVTSCLVDGNYISIQSNNFSSAVASESASCIRVLSTLATITNNFLNFKNVTVATNFAGCLYVDTRKVGSVGSGLITHNHFARANDAGTQSSITAYIYINSSANTAGTITNNTFDSITIDGSDLTLLSDNSSTANRWNFNNNKNQTETLNIYGNIGTYGIADPTVTPVNYFATGGGIGVYYTDSAISFNYTSSDGYTSKYWYNDTNIDLKFIWSIPIFQMIPEGAYIVSVSCPIIINSNVSGGGAKSIATLDGLTFGATTAFTNTINPLTVSGGILTFSGGTAAGLLSYPSAATTIEVSWRALSSAVRHVSFGPLSIVYRW